MSRCSVGRTPKTLRAAGFSASPLSHRSEQQKKTQNKSMHGFDWRTRRLGWRGHVCLRSGHCLGAGRLLRGKDERTIMSVNSRALCESRGQRLEPLGGSCCLSISCKVLFPSLSLRLFRSSLSFDGLLSCIHPGPACKKTTALSLCAHMLRRRRRRRRPGRLG